MASGISKVQSYPTVVYVEDIVILIDIWSYTDFIFWWENLIVFEHMLFCLQRHQLILIKQIAKQIKNQQMQNS